MTYVLDLWTAFIVTRFLDNSLSDLSEIESQRLMTAEVDSFMFTFVNFWPYLPRDHSIIKKVIMSLSFWIHPVLSSSSFMDLSIIKIFDPCRLDICAWWEIRTHSHSECWHSVYSTTLLGDTVFSPRSIFFYFLVKTQIALVLWIYIWLYYLIHCSFLSVPYFLLLSFFGARVQVL